MANAYKLYLPNGKYKVIDEEDYIELAKYKIANDDSLKKKYLNKDINKLIALKIFKEKNIKIVPTNALLIAQQEGKDPILKTIEKIEEDIQNFIFKNMKEDADKFTAYFQGSKKAAIEILKKDLNYKVVNSEQTLENFIDKEVYYTSNITYKNNRISVELTKDKFICDFNTNKIYKYEATIIDEEGYQFNFRKNELFVSREEAIKESKKLVDEHYNLAIRNSKIQKIIVRTDENNTVIVFWPDIDTDEEYIMANDIIGTTDLAGDTKTSLLYFNECKDATPAQVQMAKNVIEQCMKIQTMSVKHL